MSNLEIPLVSAQEFIAIAEAITQQSGRNVVRKVFRSHGFSDRILSEPDLQLPNSEYLRFLEACARQTKQLLFGAMIGNSVPFSELGTYGRYVASAPTLESALYRAARALRYHETGSRLDQSSRGSYTELIYHPSTPKALGVWHQCDGVAALLINLIKMYEGQLWKPEGIGLIAASGRRNFELEAFFGVQVHDTKEGVELLCSFKMLSATRTEPPEVSNNMTFKDIRKMVSSRPSRSFSGTLKQLLVPMVRDGVFELKQLSKAVGIGVRTIQRHLKSEGTTYGKLVQEVRHNWALEMLTNPELDIGEIATRLGYSSKQHFIRAFKGWSGNTPGAYRQLTM